MGKFRDWWNGEKPDWKYLGWVELKFCDRDDATKITSACVVHFYATVTADDEWLQRRTELSISPDTFRRHGWYQKNVVPWLEGGNVYTPVEHPSEWLLAYAKDKHGYTRFDGKWVKPAPQVEHSDNVVTPVKWGKRGDS